MKCDVAMLTWLPPPQFPAFGEDSEIHLCRRKRRDPVWKIPNATGKVYKSAHGVKQVLLTLTIACAVRVAFLMSELAPLVIFSAPYTRENEDVV